MLLMARRKLKRDYATKIPGRSVAEVTERFENEVARQSGGRAMQFHGQKVTAEAITNAIVMHFLSLSQRERDEILDDYVAKFEEIVRLPETVAPETKMPAEEAGSKGGFDLGSGGRVGKATYPSGHKRKRG